MNKAFNKWKDTLEGRLMVLVNRAKALAEKRGKDGSRPGASVCTITVLVYPYVAEAILLQRLAERNRAQLRKVGVEVSREAARDLQNNFALFAS
jgi:hypothetical protein